MTTTNPYGRCPICGAPGILRERRPNGNDKCSNGHVYPSRDAIQTTGATTNTEALVQKLRYMGRQYAAGQVSRGGAPKKHYLEEAADTIERLTRERDEAVAKERERCADLVRRFMPVGWAALYDAIRTTKD